MANKIPIDPSIRKLSPLRKTTQAQSITELTEEQLAHFGIDAQSPFGQSLFSIVEKIYHGQGDIDQLWKFTLDEMQHLDKTDKVAYFNALKFLSFQLAKLLDTLQNPFRRAYQNMEFSQSTLLAKSCYPVFDNVTAIFSATPVIARTATYIYACAEWIEDAFKGKELLLEIYSRLLNPTSLSLANHIVDIEAGPYASEYLAWNYNSGMAAIDAVLSHVLGRNDILITNRNIYGGAHQLIHDWYAKPSNLQIRVATFDGYSVADFARCLAHTQATYGGETHDPDCPRSIYVYLESPSNPHGYVLDVPGICKLAHQHDIRVMLDATVGTPFLVHPLRRVDCEERPDFVIHSYTKDLSGTGSVIAGVVLGRNEDMFIPKGEPGWENTMFWNVYYVKGAFLNADAAYEVLQGMRTLESRMLSKCINTKILAQFLASHAQISVHCNGLQDNTNHALCAQLLYLGLSAPLFTIDMEQVPLSCFQRFFDALEPTFGHMISLGQTNTIVSCPGLTTHSELDAQQLNRAAIKPTTIRFAVGDENPLDLIVHLVRAAQLTIDPYVPGFSRQFESEAAVRERIKAIYLQVHEDYINDQLNQ